MTGMYGADSQALRQLAGRMKDGATLLTQRRNAIDSGLHDAPWVGAVADRFRAQWNGGGAAALTAMAGTLEQAAADLLRNADEQDQASADSGVSASGAAAAATAAAAAAVAGFGAGGSPGGSGLSPRLGLSEELGDGKLDPKAYAELELGGTEASGKWGASKSFSGSFGNDEGVSGSGQVDFDAGVAGSVSASHKLTADGYEAQFKMHAQAGVGAQAEGELNYGDLSLKGNADVYAGAKLDANAALKVGPGGASVNAGIDGFAGFEANAGGEFGVDGAKVGAQAHFQAGLGVKGNADISVTPEHIKAEISFSAALGVGGGATISIDIEPKKVIEKVGKIFPWNR